MKIPKRSQMISVSVLITVVFLTTTVFITSCNREEAAGPETMGKKPLTEGKPKAPEAPEETPEGTPEESPEKPGNTITLSKLSLEKYPTITTYLLITDSVGKPINVINIENIKVTEEDQPVGDLKIDQADPVSDPLSVVLAIDISGSMAGTPLEKAKLAAEDFVNLLNTGDRAALVTFDQDVYTNVPLTEDKEALIDAIRGLRHKGDTALYQAVIDSSNILKRAPDGRRIVIVLTDGINDKANSLATKEDSITVAGTARAIVITVGLGGRIDANTLKNIADETGGRFFHAPAPEDLQQIYTLISEQIHAQYRLSFTSPFPERPDRAIVLHTIRVSLRYGGEDVMGSREFLASTNPPVDSGTLEEGSILRLLIGLGDSILYILLLVIFILAVTILSILIVRAKRTRS